MTHARLGKPLTGCTSGRQEILFNRLFNSLVFQLENYGCPFVTERVRLVRSSFSRKATHARVSAEMILAGG